MDTTTASLQTLFDFAVLEEPDEVWKDVPGYERIYQASTWGRIRSLDRKDAGGRKIKGRILVQVTNADTPYPIVSLSDGTGKHKLAHVHNIIALTFIGPKPEGYTVNHVDGSKTNNRPENLEYVTQAENNRHARDVLGSRPRGRVLTEAQAREIYTRANVDGEKQRDTARAYGISIRQVREIKKGRAWRHP